jgi:hypothetical protein
MDKSDGRVVGFLLEIGRLIDYAKRKVNKTLTLPTELLIVTRLVVPLRF